MMFSKATVDVRPKGTNMLKITIQQTSVQPLIVGHDDSRGAMARPWHLGSEPDRLQKTQERSEMFHNVCKTVNLELMLSTIEKCRDLK
jgi:hypothetical protein